MFKLDFEKAEEPEIKFPTSVGPSKNKRIPENIYFCFIGYTKAFNCVDHNKLWKIIRDGNIRCLLRNLYAGQEATVRTGHGTTNWFKLEKEYVKAVYCHPAYLISMQRTS